MGALTSSNRDDVRVAEQQKPGKTLTQHRTTKFLRSPGPAILAPEPRYTARPRRVPNQAHAGTHRRGTARREACAHYSHRPRPQPSPATVPDFTLRDDGGGTIRPTTDTAAAPQTPPAPPGMVLQPV